MARKPDLTITTKGERCQVIFSGHRRQLARLLAACERVIMITNPTVFGLHGRIFIRDYLPPQVKVIPFLMGDGERFKTRRTVETLHDRMFEINLGRDEVVVAFGGGVVGDTAGFAAATYKRGVSIIQVPTTLLAMVDSSIGGKVGINHARGKNLIGAFHQPLAVIIEPRWLRTLGQREIVEGLAEIMKVGFLSTDTMLAQAAGCEPKYGPGTEATIASLIHQAAAFKSAVVACDARDRGLRAILNLGHTFAHAIEKAEGYRRIRHGEAVMAGMAGALFLSQLVGNLTERHLKVYLGYLSPWMKYLPPLKKAVGVYFSAMAVDKKNSRGRMQFILLEKIGRTVLRPVEPPEKVIAALELMKAFVNRRGIA